MKRKPAIFYLMIISLLILGCASSTPIIASPFAPTLSIPEQIELKPVDIPNATVLYYDISGSTEIELRDQLNISGPVGYDGYKGDATTEWFVRWNWTGFGTNTCDLAAAKITYDITVILPRWNPPTGASPDLITKWGGYINLLSIHEKGHVDHLLENFQSLVAAIKGGTCETADSTGNTMLDELRRYDVDYDAETQHGAAQGAIFP